MKKIIVFLFLMFISQASFAYDYSQMCAVPPYPVSSGVPRFFSNATGMNFLITQVAESQIQRSLNKEIDGNFKVKIKPYGAKNLLDGKFKSLTITSKKVMYGEAGISDFRAKTICDYNQVVLKNKDVYFAQNLIFNYSGFITSKDFQNIVLSKEYISFLEKMNVTIVNKVIFKVFDPKVKIDNDRIQLAFKVMTPLSFAEGVSNVTLNAGLAIQDEKIVFTDIDFGSANSRLNLSKMLPIINRLNPLTYEFDLSKSSKGILKVSNVKIAQSKIFVDGVFIIPQNYGIK